MFFLKFAIFLFLNILLYLSIFRFLYFLKNKISTLDRTIFSFLIYLTTLLGISLILGLVHIYEIKIVALFIIFFTLFFSFFKGEIKKSFIGSYEKLKGLFGSFFFSLKNDPLLIFLFSIIFLEFIILARFTFIYPPYGWDSYTYHLPLSWRFVGVLILHLPFLIFGSLSSYSILRKLNISKDKSIYIFSLLCMPIIPNLAGTLYIDIEVSSMLLIFLNLLLTDFPYNLIFPLLSLSIAAGMKWSVLPIFFIFLLYGLIKLLIKRKYILILFIFLLSSITSFPQYLYNIYLKGNPIHPFYIKIFGIKIFNGINPPPSQLGDFPVFTYNPFIIIPQLLEFGYDYINYYIYDNHSGGFGPLFVSFGVIPFILSIFFVIKKGDKHLLKIFFWCALIFLTVPYRWWTRFHIYLPFVAFIGAIYLWEKLKQVNLQPLIILITFFSFIEGLILRNNFYLFIDAVEKKEDLKFYDKILASPEEKIENYKKIYQDENLSLWIR